MKERTSHRQPATLSKRIGVVIVANLFLPYRHFLTKNLYLNRNSVADSAILFVTNPTWQLHDQGLEKTMEAGELQPSTFCMICTVEIMVGDLCQPSRMLQIQRSRKFMGSTHHNLYAMEIHKMALGYLNNA